MTLKVQINHLKTIKTKIWEKWSQTKIWLDLHEIFTLVNFKVLNTNLYLKILYLKFKFRQFGAKIKIPLLENVNTSQFEGAEYESYIGDLSRHYTIHLIEIN